jgi:hypothetical protein
MTNRSKSRTSRTRTAERDAQQVQGNRRSESRLIDRSPARQFLISLAWLRLFRAIVSKPGILPHRRTCSHEI